MPLVWIKKRRKELLLLFVTVTVVLGIIGAALEIYGRSIYAARRADLEAKFSIGPVCYRQSEIPGLIYERVPNVCVANSIGFADHEPSIPKQKGKKRILVIGDSVVEGVGVDPLWQYFGKVLTTELNRKVEGEPYEPVKLAVSGYTLSQELILLKEKARELEPDLILWTYVLNDPAHPVFHNSGNNQMGEYFYEPNSFALHWLRERIFFSRENALKPQGPEDFHQVIHQTRRDHIRNSMEEIKKECEDMGVPHTFLILPTFDRDFSEYPYVNIHEDLKKMGAESGLRVMDLLPSFAGKTREEVSQKDQYSGRWDAWHPNAQGHDIVAKALVEPVWEMLPPDTQ